MRAEVAHKSQLDDYVSYKAAKQGVSKFFNDVIDKIWYNDLKNADTSCKGHSHQHHVPPQCQQGGLHALNMILHCTDMMQYYMQADGIPQLIVMMEDFQKKAKPAGMPIADIELVMMASAAALAAQHFSREVGNWEGLLAGSCT